jgi:hypothetical protein
VLQLERNANMAGKRTIKIGTIFNLAADAHYYKDSSQLFDRHVLWLDQCTFGEKNTRVKVVEIHTRPNLYFKVQSTRDPSKCGYVKIAGLRSPKIASIEVIDESIPDAPKKPEAPARDDHENFCAAI